MQPGNELYVQRPTASAIDEHLVPERVRRRANNVRVCMTRNQRYTGSRNDAKGLATIQNEQWSRVVAPCHLCRPSPDDALARAYVIYSNSNPAPPAIADAARHIDRRNSGSLGKAPCAARSSYFRSA
jgi:hypothetical protein